MSGPRVTSICKAAPLASTPVCRPPFGNDTHSVHFGRRHVCANALEASVIATTAAARMIEMRILHHPGLWFRTGFWLSTSSPHHKAKRGDGGGEAVITSGETSA